MGQLRMVMRRGFAQLAHAPRWMLTLKRTVENFVGLLGEWHGYYVVPLFQELERTQEQYGACAHLDRAQPQPSPSPSPSTLSSV